LKTALKIAPAPSGGCSNGRSTIVTRPTDPSNPPARLIENRAFRIRQCAAPTALGNFTTPTHRSTAHRAEARYVVPQWANFGSRLQRSELGSLRRPSCTGAFDTSKVADIVTRTSPCLQTRTLRQRTRGRLVTDKPALEARHKLAQGVSPG
jgi:hypothetical protein